MSRLLALAALFGLALVAQPVPGRYLVELKTKPVLDLMDRTRGIPSASQLADRRRQIATEQTAVSREVTARGWRVLHSFSTAANMLSVAAPKQDASNLAALSGVRAVYPVYRVHPSLDRAQVLHKVVDAWQLTGGRDQAGAGIKIGIVDTGIDTTHPGFQDTTLQVPAGFPKFRTDADKGVLTNKVIAGRSYDDLYNLRTVGSAADCYGHGTGVAMAAAGVPIHANYADVSGMAPKAFLGSYRVFSNCSGDGYTDVILRAVSDAIDDGMDVINLSLGSAYSDLETEAAFATVFKRASDAGIVVVVAAGNAGPDPLTIGSPSTAPDVISVGAMINDRTFRFPVTVPGLDTAYGQPSDGPNMADALSGQMVDVAASATNPVGCNPYASNELAGRIALVPRGSCDFETKITLASRAGATGVLVTNTANSTVTMAVRTAKLPAMMVTRAVGLSIRAALAANPELTVKIDFRGESVPLDYKQLPSFSARGPSILTNYAVKPDLVATGAYVYTAALTNPDAEIHDGSGFALSNGTSYSSPIVAGAAAVLKGARPGLSAAQYRSLLINGAAPFVSNAGYQFTPVEAGAGMLDLASAVRNKLTLSDTSLSFGLVGGGSFDLPREVTVTNVGAEDEIVNIDVQTDTPGVQPVLSDTRLAIPAGKTAKFTVRMQGTDILGGAYQGWVRLHGTVSGSELRMPYWMTRPTGVPARVSIVSIDPETASPGQWVQIAYRVLDSAGIPLNWDVTATAATTGTRIYANQNVDYTTPGLWLLTLRTSLLSGVNQVTIQRNDLVRDISIITQ